MCGIFSLFGNTETYSRQHYINLSKKIRHRGPDWNGIYVDSNCVLSHERLSIVGVNSGAQPLSSKDKTLHLSVNGEIYNHKQLYEHDLNSKYEHITKSDCEIILSLYREYGYDFYNKLDGIFSFVLYDSKLKHIIVARDPMGVIPLFYGFDKYNNLLIASEQKSLSNCVSVKHFLPGTMMIFDLQDTGPTVFKTLTPYNPQWRNRSFDSLCNEEELASTIKTALIKSVEKRLMTEVPFGVLLSGGLDSSLVASITSRIIKDKELDYGNKLHTFSIGLEGSPDLICAKRAADFLGTIHHEFTFTIQEGLDAVKDLVWHLETFDVTTIRASTPMYLLSRKIKSLGIKMVLSGEGADEIFGGYLYFHNAPNDEEFHSECIRRVNNLHLFDCLRANKSTMAWGLEARVPFLDKEFLEVGMPVHPKHKCNKIEKYILRKAFDDKENPFLPDEILWRQKEQFSDGVGYSWVDNLKVFCESHILDNEYEMLVEKFKNDDIRSKESAYYRKLYEELFPNRAELVERWIPKLDWDGVEYDPSGRVQKNHNNKINV